MKNSLLMGAAMARTLIASAPAQAVTLNWTLQGVQFNDGGTASGTFSTDSTSGNLISFNIATTAGSTLAGAIYDPATSFIFGDNFYSANSFLLATTTPFAKPYLNLSFANPLTSGGVNMLNLGGILAGSWECMNCSPIRNVTAGYATTVPEPASWALMIAGFGLTGAAMRRRRTALAA